MFIPMPTPGAAFEEAQRAMFKVNGFPGVSSEEGISTALEVSDSRFSRLLAGKMESSPQERSGAERAPDKEATTGTAEDLESRKQATGSASSDPEGRTERPSIGEGQAASTDGEAAHWPSTDASLTENLVVWSGLDLVDMNQVPADPAGRLIPGPVWQNGLPVELKTRLAADIAARFTNRDGLQTLTLKLDPEHLGKLDIQLKARDNHLTVRFLVASRESEAALKDNIKELTETIQKQSGRFQQVEVRVDLKQNEDLADPSPEEQPGHSPHDDSRGESRQDQGNHDEPNGQDVESHTAGSEAPVQGG